ncbi:MAG: symmetrical bis(5'-nucleosyl)-tetraphosphatase [Marinobacter sp.]|uniref:symmetrical bis(5'-nucleosyl)-tetraphosphatase n=1 Tax=Marinobacter sp. TaxID=50741 RepID=UPI00299DAF07|nr:symmetrical bis(5'-nucleosyl)-tetraphosphatase [Marinobacter sp.]MDX1633576.1 symmetrical bis(5'-nucleosyl)-tetraphosphatase [Marinobacter sp.]
MTDYAIGDIQGCYQPLRKLLEQVDFSPSRDRLWVAGDLINRGPESLQSLRYIESLEASAVVVLGNHDLHLLAVILGGHKLRNKDTLDDILAAPDRDRLVEWLRQQKLCVYDPDRNYFMSHAGLPHIWSVDDALGYAKELATIIRGPDAGIYFTNMYGNQPERWDRSLTSMDRWRMITNYFTRMRFIAEDGTLELSAKESAEEAPEGFAPWFSYPRQDDVRIIFGHWAALEGRTGDSRYIGLDTGCVWGGALTLMNLDTGEKTRCEC